MEEKQKPEQIVYGKNPVVELLKSGGVDTVMVSDSMAPQQAAYYGALAKQAGAVLKKVHPNKLRQLCGTENHQGVIRLEPFQLVSGYGDQSRIHLFG